MHAIYYQRKRDQGYDEKTMLIKVLTFIGNSEQQGKPIKTLLFSAEEFAMLESEVRQLAADVNFWKAKDPTQGIARIIGCHFEVLDTVTKETVLKVDKGR